MDGAAEGNFELSQGASLGQSHVGVIELQDFEEVSIVGHGEARSMSQTGAAKRPCFA